MKLTVGGDDFGQCGLRSEAGLSVMSKSRVVGARQVVRTPMCPAEGNGVEADSRWTEANLGAVLERREARARCTFRLE